MKAIKPYKWLDSSDVVPCTKMYGEPEQTDYNSNTNFQSSLINVQNSGK